jgi:hypothetical protein
LSGELRLGAAVKWGKPVEPGQGRRSGGPKSGKIPRRIGANRLNPPNPLQGNSPFNRAEHSDELFDSYHDFQIVANWVTA